MSSLQNNRCFSKRTTLSSEVAKIQNDLHSMKWPKCVLVSQSHLILIMFLLQHALSGNARIMPFDPKVTSKQECIITTFQDVYFVSNSFEEAKVKMRWATRYIRQKSSKYNTLFNNDIYVHFREFAKTIKRPFTVRYNPYTQSVDVLKDTPSINSVVEELRHELDIVGDALSRLNKQLGIWPPAFKFKLSISWSYPPPL